MDSITYVCIIISDGPKTHELEVTGILDQLGVTSALYDQLELFPEAYTGDHILDDSMIGKWKAERGIRSIPLKKGSSKQTIADNITELS